MGKALAVHESKCVSRKSGLKCFALNTLCSKAKHLKMYLDMSSDRNFLQIIQLLIGVFFTLYLSKTFIVMLIEFSKEN